MYPRRKRVRRRTAKAGTQNIRALPRAASFHIHFPASGISSSSTSPVNIFTPEAEGMDLDSITECSPPVGVRVTRRLTLASDAVTPRLPEHRKVNIGMDVNEKSEVRIFLSSSPESVSSTAALKPCSTVETKKERNKLRKLSLSPSSSAAGQLVELDNILLEILLRLPVKSIARLKSVSKSWRAMLSSSHFADRHLDFTKLERCARVLLSPQIHMDGAECLEFDFSSYLVGSCEADCVTMPMPVKYKPNMMDSFYPRHCDGIVVFAIGPQIHAWNPATGEHRALPVGSICPKHRVFDESCRIGFGFDPNDEEYKVVRLVYKPYWSSGGTISYGLSCEIFVLNGENNSWKAIADEQRGCRVKGYSAFQDGLVFWKIEKSSLFRSSGKSYSILCLNLRDEKFQVVPSHPKDIFMKYKKFSLWEANGNACLALYSKDSEIHLRMLRKDCDPSNIMFKDWIAFETIRLSKVPKYFHPLGILNREILFKTDHRLFVYDPLTQMIRVALDIHPDFISYSQKKGFSSRWNSPCCYEITLFVDSLRSFGGSFGQISNDQSIQPVKH